MNLDGVLVVILLVINSAWLSHPARRLPGPTNNSTLQSNKANSATA